MALRKRITKILPTHIGGPGTLLPLLVESFLSWALAISCLGVALWHYEVDRYRTRIASACGSNHQKQQGIFLPLTTHSRREWSTVSDYQGLRNRYYQLLRIIYSATIRVATKVPSEEKKDDDEEDSMDSTEYVIVNGKTSQEKQSQQDRKLSSAVGESVAKWLLAGLEEVRPRHPMLISTPLAENNNQTQQNNLNDESDSLDDRDPLEMLIRLVRTNAAARRLASLLLGEDPIHGDTTSSDHGDATDTATTKIKTKESKEKLLQQLSSEEPGAKVVLQALRTIWPQLLELPACDRHGHSEKVAISIIVPSFREEGGKLAAKLQASMENAAEPRRIEIIVVRVVEKDENHGTEEQNRSDNVATALRECFDPAVEDVMKNEAPVVSAHPELRILDYHEGGGRGPCLNYGAKHARGSILSFLHADTRLATYGWDKAISNALEENKSTRTTCCSFSFAIDTSSEALTVRQKTTGGQEKSGNCDSESDYNYQRYYPPGLRAIEVTANLRCKFFALPYGDQCLSLPTDVFQYIGGYPDQCLMEDYELIRLLRMRSAASRGWDRRGLDPNLDQRQERIKIISGYKAICSPRRWQHYGVLHVTYTNSYCVKLYNNGKLTPDELFCRYYKTTTPPNRLNGDKSPWEI